MSEIRDQLVSHLQSLIGKRMSEQKPCTVNNLVGQVSQYREFREWLQNNYKNDFKYNLMELIQEDSHHFLYDFQTGNISVNNCLDLTKNPVSAPILLKPRILFDLENSITMDTIDDKLAVLELILFVIDVTKNTAIVSELIQSIEQKCEKQFNCFKSRIGLKDIKTDPEINLNLNESHLIYLLTKLLNPFFSFDSSQMIISQMSESSELLDTLTRSCICLVKHCLVRHFYRFGRKTSNELYDWFEDKYQILTEFLTNQNMSLKRIIGLFPREFQIRATDWTPKLIDLNPELLGKTRYIEFELMYKYGHEIRGIDGIVTNVDRSSAKLESNIVFSVNYYEVRPDFKAIANCVEVFGQEINDLTVFIHSGDHIIFDVKFVQNFDDFCDEKTKNSFEYLWLVSGIYSIKHSAKCYVNCMLDVWNQYSYSTKYNDYSSDDSREELVCISDNEWK